MLTAREIAKRAAKASCMRASDDKVIRAFNLQKEEELCAVIAYLQQLDPLTKMLEIGSAAGGTFLAWCAVAAKDALVVSVDLHSFDEDRELMQGYALPGQSIHFIRGDSRSTQTKAQVVEIATDFDFLFIDGDHSEEFVRADWANYSPLVRDGGLIAFHDISDGGPIGMLWNELSHQFWNIKFVEFNGNDGWGGIGILRVHHERA